MTQKDILALSNIRSSLVDQRRAAALAGDADGVIYAQQKVALVDAALSDEQALGQAEKDEIAISHAIRREPDPTKVEEISLVDHPIRISD